ncbi:hypothetical protein Y09_1149 [Brachybacterium sp. SW0106-09]|nr:hypothetical protein Y09_1149 [Brachybacterium sp. SW0106-09]
MQISDALPGPGRRQTADAGAEETPFGPGPHNQQGPRSSARIAPPERLRTILRQPVR